MPPTAIIQVTHLHKEYRSVRGRPGFVGGLRTLFSRDYETIPAVQDISFTIEPGELVGYIGPNGAGKSTTIKMLTGILHPTRGQVSVAGLIPYQERMRNARQIGVIFGQRSHLLWDLPPRDAFDYMRRMYAIPPARYRENLALFCELLALEDLLDRPVRQLSLGQRMRCELVASLLHDPAIVYLDEPTIGLDVVAKERIREFIQVLNRERGVTVLLTTHDIADIEKLCRRVMIIDRGQIIYDGALAALKQKYGRVRRLIFTTVDGRPPAALDAHLRTLGQGIQIEPEDGKIIVRFDPHEVGASALTRAIVNQYAVSDLTVEEVALEGIIRQIYSGATPAPG